MASHPIKPDLLDRLACPQCERQSLEETEARLFCPVCGFSAIIQAGVPLITPPPPGLVPSEKIPRGPGLGTPWRQANWRFLQEQAARLEREAVILDVGAGRGDFADLWAGRRVIALDVYPYPEIDLVCDLTLANPFRPGSFDAVALMNVLEHVYDGHALLGALARLLKPGGVLIVAIPFLVKIHQAPVDFVRYTHFALERLGREHGLTVETLEGYYDPVFFLGEALGNLRWSVLPGLPRRRRLPARLALAGIQGFSSLLDRLVGKGQARPPAQARSLAPTGYQVVYRRSSG